MTRRLVVTPEAKAQLNNLYEYLAREASLEIATRYIDAIMARIAGLTDFPHRGTARGDIRPGLRTVPFRRRLTIAYAVTPRDVRIIGIAGAGQESKELVGEG
ncbi:MAG: type II toxin-antitoxin system RelE/ParE family toxin [Allosphingosinicella sp.]